jgi:DNA-binding CsgD family transcriptional regulator
MESLSIPLKKFSLPKKEKEERVCKLIKQGKGVREIAAAEHLSFTQIKKIRIKYFETDEDETDQNMKRSEALKLMEEGKSSLDIAIELNLSADEVQGFRREHLTLKGEDELLAIYRRIGGKIEQFVTLYEMMNKEGLAPDEAVCSLQNYGTFENIDRQYTHLAKTLRQLKEETSQLEEKNQMLVSENERLTDENYQLQMRKQHLSDIIEPMADFTNKLQGDKDVFEQPDAQLELFEQQIARLDLSWLPETIRKLDRIRQDAADDSENKLL